jgi:hypothetical protein
VAEAGGQGALQLGVGLDGRRVGAEPVAQGQVAGQGRAAGGADVEVVGRAARWGGEGLAAGDAQVALVGVAEGTEAFDDRRQVGGVATTTSRSMIGLAARPGTAVLPTCSMRTARGPRAAARRSRSWAKWAGQRGS